MFRILSLDGGGIRGAFGIGLLAEFEDRLGRPVTDYFDLLAGSSTGAITAACLCAGKPASAVKDFYDQNAELIFKRRGPHTPHPLLRPMWPLVSKIFRKRTGGRFDDLFRARYCPMALEEAFREGFGEMAMGDLKANRLIVPSVNLTKGRTVLFRTPHLPEMAGKGDVRVSDVLLAATAAPTYFPHHTLPDGDAYCDGGLWAVNPSLLAVAEAVKIQQCESGAPLDGAAEPTVSQGVRLAKAYDLSRVQLLSVGAGMPLYSLSPPGADAGALYWSRHVADVMGTSQAQGTQHPLEYTLGERYRHVNFEIPHSEWSLDGIEHREVMYGLGRLRAREVFDLLEPDFFDSPARFREGRRYDVTTGEAAAAVPEREQRIDVNASLT